MPLPIVTSPPPPLLRSNLQLPNLGGLVSSLINRRRIDPAVAQQKLKRANITTGIAVAKENRNQTKFDQEQQDRVELEKALGGQNPTVLEALQRQETIDLQNKQSKSSLEKINAAGSITGIGKKINFLNIAINGADPNDPIQGASVRVLKQRRAFLTSALNAETPEERVGFIAQANKVSLKYETVGSKDQGAVRAIINGIPQGPIIRTGLTSTRQQDKTSKALGTIVDFDKKLVTTERLLTLFNKPGVQKLITNPTFAKLIKSEAIKGKGTDPITNIGRNFRKSFLLVSGVASIKELFTKGKNVEGFSSANDLEEAFKAVAEISTGIDSFKVGLIKAGVISSKPSLGLFKAVTKILPNQGERASLFKTKLLTLLSEQSPELFTALRFLSKSEDSSPQGFFSADELGNRVFNAQYANETIKGLSPKLQTRIRQIKTRLGALVKAPSTISSPSRILDAENAVVKELGGN